MFVSGSGSESESGSGLSASASRCGHGLYNCRQLTHVAREATCHWLHSSVSVCHLHHSPHAEVVVVVVFYLEAKFYRTFIAAMAPHNFTVFFIGLQPKCLWFNYVAVVVVVCLYVYCSSCCCYCCCT